MLRSYNLKLNKKFKGGMKKWEGFNHLTLTLFMDENLTILSDVVLCLHDHIRASMELTADNAEAAYQTPAKRKRGASARDLAALQDEEIEDDSDLSDVGEEETAKQKRERKARSERPFKRL